MNFQNLQYFVTAAEEANLTRAAERLHISQQALSNHIAKLEEELGCRLFVRKPALELTYSGKCFLKSAAEILDIQRQTSAALGDINDGRRGELRIGISHTRGQAILPLLLPEFRRRYPLAELSVVEGSTRELETDLEKGILDVLIGFTPFMLESAEAQPLFRDRLCLVAPKELLKAAFGARAGAVLDEYRETQDIRLFRELPFVLLQKGDRIRALTDSAFARRGVAPQVCFETRNIQTAFALAVEGMGLTVYQEMYLNSRYTISTLQNSYAGEKVDVLPFFGPDVRDTIAIGYNRERYQSQLAKDFMQLAVQKFGGAPA